MNNKINKARALVYADGDLAAKINGMVNRKNFRIHPAELRVLAKRMKAILEPAYQGPTKGVYLKGDAIMRLAAKRDAEILALQVGQTHKRLQPHLYNNNNTGE